MKHPFDARSQAGTVRLSRSGIVAVLALAAMLVSPGRAQTQFRSLIEQLPSTTNAVAILNLQSMKASPLGVREGFAANLEKAFQAGLVRVPPRATHFIAAAELDLQFMTPLYEVAVCQLDTEPSLERIVKEYGGTADTLEGHPAVQLPTDAFVVQLGPQTVGAMRPANRQAAIRWLQAIRPGTALQLSPYLQRAAGYSDAAGTDIILAIDLTGAFSFERIGKFVKANEAIFSEAGIELTKAAAALQGIQGLRVGIRIGEVPSGRLVVDFEKPLDFPPDAAKALLLETLGDAGAMIEELNQWQCEVKATEISLAGTLTRDGLRRLGSLIDSPAPAHTTGETTETIVSPGDLNARVVENSRQYFKTIVDMFDDLKRDWRELKTLASGAVYFDRYARRIDQMPTLNVDEGLLDYGQYVSQQFRAAAVAVRTMGIRGGARKAQVSGYDMGPTASYSYGGGYGSAWGGYRAGWGTVNYYNPMDTVKQVGEARRKIEAQEKATMATDVFTIRDSVIAATNEVRRGLSEKYQVQF